MPGYSALPPVMPLSAFQARPVEPPITALMQGAQSGVNLVGSAVKGMEEQRKLGQDIATEEALKQYNETGDIGPVLQANPKFGLAMKKEAREESLGQAKGERELLLNATKYADQALPFFSTQPDQARWDTFRGHMTKLGVGHLVPEQWSQEWYDRAVAAKNEMKGKLGIDDRMALINARNQGRLDQIGLQQGLITDRTYGAINAREGSAGRLLDKKAQLFPSGGAAYKPWPMIKKELDENPDTADLPDSQKYSIYLSGQAAARAAGKPDKVYSPAEQNKNLADTVIRSLSMNPISGAGKEYANAKTAEDKQAIVTREMEALRPFYSTPGVNTRPEAGTAPMRPQPRSSVAPGAGAGVRTATPSANDKVLGLVPPGNPQAGKTIYVDANGIKYVR